jgi:integrase/recombinase XerD
MLTELYPRFHARFSSLPLLGPHVERFVRWLHAEGYPPRQILLRVRRMPRVDARLQRRGVVRFEELSRDQLLDLAPRKAQDDAYLSALVRSLGNYVEKQRWVGRPALTSRQRLVDKYRIYLGSVRGLADATIAGHASTASELLAFVDYERRPGSLHRLDSHRIESFIKAVAARLSRETLQHIIARVRSFLRFLVGQGEIGEDVDTAIDTPRVYRGERLPRSLPWTVVQSFLAAIDRSTSKGRRDYAMFLLITTYGLRTSEVAALRLDDIEWRAGRLRVPRPKMQTPIMLPLTKEVGAALSANMSETADPSEIKTV